MGNIDRIYQMAGKRRYIIYLCYLPETMFVLSTFI